MKIAFVLLLFLFSVVNISSLLGGVGAKLPFSQELKGARVKQRIASQTQPEHQARGVMQQSEREKLVAEAVKVRRQLVATQKTSKLGLWKP